MKVRMICPKCIFENGNEEINWVKVEIVDNEIYKFQCSNGHNNLCYLQNPKYEILFELGLMAIIDGYQREAVASFASSVERFYEFCIEVFLTKNNINSEQFLKTWEFIKNQSERQLGAYLFLYLRELGEAPLKFDETQTSFRNKVIHKGYIPKKDEVIEYAEYVYNYIIKIQSLIKNKYSSTIAEVLMNHPRRTKKSSEDEKVFMTIKPKTSSEQLKVNCDNITVMSIPTIISCINNDNISEKRTLKEILIDLEYSSKKSTYHFTKE